MNLLSFDTIRTYVGNTSSLPPAVGYSRDIQLGSLKILTEFDRICREHNLSYFLFAGTLLGAVRHGGFVPWDDDVDVIMPRQDYERIIEIYNQHNQIPGLKALRYTYPKGIWNLIKVQHTEIPSLFIDIFPSDFYYKQLSIKENEELSNTLKQLIVDHVQGQSTWPSAEVFHHSFMELALEKLPALKPIPDVKPMLMYGPEYLHATVKYWAYDYDMVFPLRPIQFEGHTFLGPNDPDLCLTLHYGDYMRLPTSLHMHTNLDQMPMEEILAIKKFIRTK